MLKWQMAVGASDLESNGEHLFLSTAKDVPQAPGGSGYLFRAISKLLTSKTAQKKYRCTR